MKIPLSETDLMQMIHDQVQESLNLDYKRAEALSQAKGDLTKEVTKDVSAFANSAGGVIIYGIAEGSGEFKHLPVSLTPINRREFSKERLEQIISNIQPKVKGIEIIPISLSSDMNHVAYVVSIPPSETAHQCTDKRYYRRYNFQATMMEDYEIRDVMNRNRFPVVSATITLQLFFSKPDALYTTLPQMGNSKFYADFWWIIAVENTGGTVGHYIQGSVDIPRIFLKDHESHSKETVTLELSNYLRTSYGSGLLVKNSEPEYKRVLPNCSIELLSEQAAVAILKSAPFDIQWRLHCDNAPSRSGVISSKDVKVQYNSEFKRQFEASGRSISEIPFGEMTEI